jgi:hypothetical protein
MLGTGLEIALISRAGLAAGALSSVEVLSTPCSAPDTAHGKSRYPNLLCRSRFSSNLRGIVGSALFPDRVVAEMCCGYAMQFIGNKSFLFKADQDTLTVLLSRHPQRQKDVKRVECPVYS